MDPLSIAAAAAGFLAIVEQISNRLRDISRKQQDSTIVKATLGLGQQLIQLEFITRSLLDREIVTHSNTSSNASAINVVKQINLNIQSCQEVLKEVSELVDKLDNGFKEKVRWGFANHDKAMALCESLAVHYNCLDLALSTILILTTHQTRNLADQTRITASQTLHEAVNINKQVHLTREVTEGVKSSVEQVGQNVDQLGYDVSEMLALLRKFDQQKTWPFQGHAGFVTADLCFTLERYIRDQSGIDPDELRSQLSGFRTDDDVASLQSGWTWAENKGSVSENVSHPRSQYAGRRSSVNLRAGPPSVTQTSPFRRAGSPLPSGGHTDSPSRSPAGKQPNQFYTNHNFSSDASKEVVRGTPDAIGARLPRGTVRIFDKLLLETEQGGLLVLGQDDVEAKPHDEFLSIHSSGYSESQSTAPSLPESSSEPPPRAAHSESQNITVKDGDQSQMTDTVRRAYEKLQKSLLALWDNLATDDTKSTTERLQSETDINQAQRARRELPSRLTQRKLYQELHQACRTSDSSVDQITGLLEKGADPNLQPAQISRFRKSRTANPGDVPPLYLAVKSRNIRVIKCLLRYGADPDCHLVGDTPLEELLGQARTGGPDSKIVTRIAMIFARNGARITPSLLSMAIGIDDPTEDCTLLAIRLLLETGPHVLQQLDLERTLFAKQKASPVDELLVDALIQHGLQPSCSNICSAISLRNSRILTLILGSIPDPIPLPLCMERALECWNELAIKLLIAHGTPPPLEAVYRAIEKKSPALFVEIVQNYLSKGSRSLNLQRCLSKAISHWNPLDSTIVRHLIELGEKPTEEQVTTIIKYDDIETIDILLGSGGKISDQNFFWAGPDLAYRIMRSGSENITAEAKQDKLHSAVRAVLRHSKLLETVESGIGTQMHSLGIHSQHTYTAGSIEQSETHWSRTPTLNLIGLLVQEKTCPPDEILLDVFTVQPLDTELALVVLSAAGGAGDDICFDILCRGDIGILEFLLEQVAANVDIPFLLERSIEVSRYWQGKQPILQGNKLTRRHGPLPRPPFYNEADDETKKTLRETAEEMGRLIFSHWLKATPAPLRDHSLAFLVEGIPEETQRQLITRCKHHPTLATVHLLLQYSSVSKSPTLLDEALTTCLDVLDNETVIEGELDSWVDLLVRCLSLQLSSSPSHITETKHQCLELILCHMEETEIDINQLSGVGFLSPFKLLSSHCPPEDLPRTIALFCKYGANINQSPADDPSDLPLILFAEHGQEEAIRIMIECGGDLFKALSASVAEGCVRALRGGLIRESIKNGVISDSTGTTSIESENNVLRLFRIAAEACNVEVLSCLFDSGLQYSLDSDLEFLGSVAEFFYKERALPEWAQSSISLKRFCSWWALHSVGHPLAQYGATEISLQLDERTVGPLLGKRSLILSMIEKDLARSRGEALLVLLSRGVNEKVERHPSTEYLLTLAADNKELMKKLIGLKIPTTARSWEPLKTELKKYLWIHCEDEMGALGLANAWVAKFVGSQERPKSVHPEFLAFLFDVTTNIELVNNCTSVLDYIFEDYPIAEDRINVVSAFFAAISRMDPATLPAFQYYALAYSNRYQFRHLALQLKPQIYAATVRANIDTSQAALLYAANSHDWDLVGDIIQKSNHDLGAKLSWGVIPPLETQSQCRHLFRRGYFCQCSLIQECNDGMLDRGYPGNSVIFNAVQDGALEIVKQAVYQGVDFNEIYGEYPQRAQLATEPIGGTRRKTRFLTEILSPSPHSARELDLTEEELACRATLLHVAVLGCVDGPIRGDRLEILKLLLEGGAKVDTKVWVPSRFLRSASPRASISKDDTWLDAKQFAGAIYMPDERQTGLELGLKARQKSNKRASRGLRDTICDILKDHRKDSFVLVASAPDPRSR